MWFRRESRKEAEDQLDAEVALQEAQENLVKVEERSHEVRWFSNAIREIREKNHLGEQIEDYILRGKG
jgi:hypothetical protein